MHHDICLVGRRKHVDWRCQNVTKPHKQGLVTSQLTGRAERKTNRQEMVDRQGVVVVEVDTYTQTNNGINYCDFKSVFVFLTYKRFGTVQNREIK